MRTLRWLLGCCVVTACGGSDGGNALDTPPPVSVNTEAPDSTVPVPDSVTTPTTASVPSTGSVPESPESTVSSAVGRFAAGAWLVGTTPVIVHGPAERWDGQFTDPGAAIVHDGTLYVFRNGFKGFPAPVAVALATSSDGETFIDSAQPLFDFSDLDYVGVAALASSVVVQPDGTWVMYFYSWDEFVWPRSKSVIGRATAPSAQGPWTPDPAPVLVPSAHGSWDSFSVRSPSVVVDDEGLWHMWYAGSGDGKASIGHATSHDGVVWTKDPVPVLEASETGWDQPFVHQPRVTLGPDGYVMAYAAASTITDPTAVTQQHGLAVSSDGLNWSRSEIPMVTAAEAGGDNIWWTTLVWSGDRYWWLLEVGRAAETNIHLAAHRGPLLG